MIFDGYGREDYINLDMIEFSVYHQKEGKKRIFFPNNHELNHFHNFKKNFLFQPELSNLLFYIPNTSNYSHIFCRTLWNKIIRNEILPYYHYITS